MDARVPNTLVGIFHRRPPHGEMQTKLSLTQPASLVVCLAPRAMAVTPAAQSFGELGSCSNACGSDTTRRATCASRARHGAFEVRVRGRRRGLESILVTSIQWPGARMRPTANTFSSTVCGSSVVPPSTRGGSTRRMKSIKNKSAHASHKLYIDSGWAGPPRWRPTRPTRSPRSMPSRLTSTPKPAQALRYSFRCAILAGGVHRGESKEGGEGAVRAQKSPLSVGRWVCVGVGGRTSRRQSFDWWTARSKDERWIVHALKMAAIFIDEQNLPSRDLTLISY